MKPQYRAILPLDPISWVLRVALGLPMLTGIFVFPTPMFFLLVLFFPCSLFLFLPVTISAETFIVRWLLIPSRLTPPSGRPVRLAGGIRIGPRAGAVTIS